MNARLLNTLLLPLLVAGCGHALMTPSVEDADVAAAQNRTTEPITLPADPDHAAPLSALARPGDFIVFRFSGSYRKAPITMTERVVARGDDKLTVDVDITGDQHHEQLRLRLDDSATQHGKLISVARRNAGALEPFGVARYGKLMEDITLSADSNEGLIEYAEVTVDAGGHQLPCTRSSYKVHIGNRAAILQTLSSDAFPWGHAGGEIRGLDGSLLYRAELVDMGDAAHGAALAVGSEPDLYDDYDDLE